ncbi:MAG TPA: hypothetical protein VIJ55_16325 [Acetobacteraceae bacterium]
MTDGSPPSLRNFVAALIERRAEALAVSEPDLARVLGVVAPAPDAEITPMRLMAVIRRREKDPPERVDGVTMKAQLRSVIERVFKRLPVSRLAYIQRDALQAQLDTISRN